MTSPLRIGIHDSDSQIDQVATRLGGELVLGADTDALVRGDVDAIIAPLAELRRAIRDGIEIVAVAKRGDARDVLVSVGGVALAELASGARVGADSARRRAQLRASRSDLEVIASPARAADALALLRTSESGLDAVVLPATDVDSAQATETYSLADWPTDPGQGAVGIAMRADAPGDVRKRLARLEHRPSRLTAGAELAVLDGLPSAQAALVAAYAQLDDGLLFVSASLYAPDGSDSVTASHAAYPEDTKDPAAELGARVAAELLERGAADLVPE